MPDIAQIAHRIVKEATGEAAPARRKNPAAVALGRLGAKKGGIARAKKLSAKRRSQIARQAAVTRWAAEQA
jgi:hypothetical protein